MEIIGLVIFDQFWQMELFQFFEVALSHEFAQSKEKYRK